MADAIGKVLQARYLAAKEVEARILKGRVNGRNIAAYEVARQARVNAFKDYARHLLSIATKEGN